jgi:hypothetical protein
MQTPKIKTTVYILYFYWQAQLKRRLLTVLPLGNAKATLYFFNARADGRIKATKRNIPPDLARFASCHKNKHTPHRYSTSRGSSVCTGTRLQSSPAGSYCLLHSVQSPVGTFHMSMSKSKLLYELTVSQSVLSWCRSHSGTCNQILLPVGRLLSCLCGTPSLTRGRVCSLQCNHSMVRVAQNP